jgi:uncharacterized repeat protein (TIGR04076 family)
MFKVKATVVGFLGNEEKYPCHFSYKIGDEFIFDGESFHGRLCPHVISILMPKLHAVYAAGPRFVQPGYYLPFWYVPLTARDAARKDYDGVGWRVLREDIPEPPYSLNALTPKGAFAYPTTPERTVLKETMVICPDTRTSAVFRLEAFDLADRGEATPYFWKHMAILEAVRKYNGVRVEEVRDKLSRAQQEEIYPLAAPVLISTLLEELELMHYVAVESGRVRITEAGENKLAEFKRNVPESTRKALEPRT